MMPAHSGWRLHHVAETDSTNGRLLEAMGGGGVWDHARTVLRAEHQTAGRGRGGRDWDCPPGQGLLFSLRLDLDLSRHALALLGHWTALCLAEVLSRRLESAGLEVQVWWKWPNDLLLEDAGGAGKVAGVLVQTQVQGGRARAVIGVGLNVGRLDFATDLRQPARSLHQAGLAAEPGELLTDVLAELDARGAPEEGGMLLAELARVDLLASRPLWLARGAAAASELGAPLRHEHLADGRLRLSWAGRELLLADGGLRVVEISKERLTCQVES